MPRVSAFDAFARASRQQVRFVQVALAVTALTAVLAVTIGVASRVASRSELDRLPHPGALDFSTDPQRTLPILAADFVATVLGTRQANPGAAGAPERERAGGGSGAPTMPRPAGPMGSRPVIPGAEPSTTDVLAPGDWALTVDMTADATTVRSGEWIDYTMTVTNVGTAPFPPTGAFELKWHTPLHTTSRVPQDCRLPLLGNVPALDRLCTDGLAPFPGLGEVDDPTGGEISDGRPLVNLHNGYSSAGQSVEIPAGGTYVRHYRVQVTPSAPEGSTIVNHTHLDVLTDSAPGITSAVVSVTVRDGLVPEEP